MNQLGTIVNYVCIVPWIRTTREISLSALSAARSDGRAQWLLYISRLGRGGDRKKQGADMMCCSFTCVLSIHLFICFLWGWLGDFLWLFMLRKMKSRLLTCSLRYGEACSNENLQFNWKYWLIYGDAFRCLDKVWPTHFQVGAPARSCSWSPVGGQGSSCFCVASCPSSLLLLLTLFSIRTWCLVSPLQPTQRHPGLSLTSAPRFFCTLQNCLIWTHRCSHWK